MIAALYVQPRGVYADRVGVDPWPESRDARLYVGPHPVVAHPPCSRWCMMARVNEARYGHKVGDDGGCFYWALWSVQRYGGVLEHPARSLAWPAFDLLKPARGSWQPCVMGGYVTEVSQVAYGHLARKRTWLYYRGAQPPFDLDWGEPPARAQVGHDKNQKNALPRVSKREASATPPAFAAELIRLAEWSRGGT